MTARTRGSPEAPHDISRQIRTEQVALGYANYGGALPGHLVAAQTLLVVTWPTADHRLLLIWLAVLLGLCWAAVGIPMPYHGDGLQVGFAVVLLSGMASRAVVALGPLRRAYLTFTLLVLLCMVVALGARVRPARAPRRRGPLRGQAPRAGRLSFLRRLGRRTR